MWRKLREPAIAQKVAVALLLAGFCLLIVEVRFEHQAVLGKKWQAWMPIIYSALMFISGPIALFFWNRGGRIFLSVAFTLSPILGLLGFWFHSKGDPWLALCKVFKVICMMPGKIPMDTGGPPVLAPLALAGLGMLGIVLCSVACSTKPPEKIEQAAQSDG